MTRNDDDKTRKQRSIAQARDGLAHLVHEVEQGAPVEITRRGKPVAVLVSFAEYQRLMGEGPSFWDALLAFRAASAGDPETLGVEPALFPRDKSSGRAVDLS